MKALFKLIYTCIITSFGLMICNAQEKLSFGELKMATTISKTIKGGQTHSYDLQLNKNEFVLIEAIQKKVDFIVSIFNETGNKIRDFDSYNGENGPEYVRINSINKGTYKLTISHLDNNGKQGEYDIRIVKREAIGKTKQEKLAQLFCQFDTTKNPGMGVSIVQNNESLIHKAYGIANLEYGIPFTTNSVSGVGSISKQFTAFSILLLEQLGKLNLDDNIRKYIPEIPDFGHPITIQNLANHTSGLRELDDLLVLSGWKINEAYTNDDVLMLLKRQKDLDYIPGEQFSYTNTGYMLLAIIVERISQMIFPEFTEKKIFAPLGMNSTEFYNDSERLIPNRAYSYYQGESSFKKEDWHHSIVGSTGLFTSLHDLSIWVENLRNYKIGNKAIVDKMYSLGVLANGINTDYGMGAYPRMYSGINGIGHGGVSAGYRALAFRFLEEDLSIILIGCDSAFLPDSWMQDILSIIVPEKIKKNDRNTNSSNANEKTIEKPVSDMAIYVGDYFSKELNLKITVKEEKGNLTAFPQDLRLPLINLQPKSMHIFNGNQWPFKKFKFSKNSSEIIDAFYLSSDRSRDMKFKKIVCE